MPYSIFPPLPFQLPEIAFPFHKLKIESLPIHLNHEYYSDLFENDFLCMIPECFGLLAVFIVLLYGVIFSNGNAGKKLYFDSYDSFIKSKQNKCGIFLIAQRRPL